MATNQAELAIVIKAIDEASDNMRKVADNSKQSMDATQKAVFNATAAWDLLKQGVGMAADFAKDSIGAYLGAAKEMDLARANIKAAGLDWATVGVRLEEFGKKAIQMGMDDDQAVLSASKLAKAAGGDMAQGLNLATLAANLTASGFGSLEENTSNLTAILAGKGSLAARAYRLNLSDTATTGEILNAVQKKVTQTAKEYGDTIPGKIASVKLAFEDLKEQVGEGLVSGFVSATKAIGNTTNATDKMAETSKVLRLAMYELASSLAVVINTFALFVAAGKNIVYVSMAAKDAITGNFKSALDDLHIAGNNSRDSLGNLGTSITALLDPVGNLTKYEQENSIASKIAGTNVEDYSQSVKNAENITDSFKDAVKDANAELLKMAREFAQTQSDTMQEGKDQTVDYLAKVIGENDKAKEKIANNQEEIKDLIITNGSYISQSERLANNQRILDLREETLRLQDEMAERDFIINKNADLQKLYQSEISERSKYFAADEISRIKIDTATKLLENQKEYLQKQINLLLDLKDKKAAMDQEVAFQKEKATAVTGIESGMTQAVKEECNSRLGAIQGYCSNVVSVYRTTVTQLNSLASQLSSRAQSAFNVSVSKVTPFASGGIVTSPTLALIGEAGPEAVVPLNRTSGGGFGGNTYVVNINGGNYLDRQAAEKMGNFIIDKLRLQLRF